MQVIQNCFAHFTQIVRGKCEPRVSGVHGNFKREGGGAVEDVRCVFKRFTQWDPGVYTEQFQMTFVFSAVCEGLNANGFAEGGMLIAHLPISEVGNRYEQL